MSDLLRSLLENKTATIRRVCDAIDTDDVESAVTALRADYVFAPLAPVTRNYGPTAMTRVFVRDGFIDRYSGARLLFPPVLRLLSAILPEEFPYHRNWKADVTHQAYYELVATLDHLVPVSAGGLDRDDNMVTTSMALNSAKMNWTLELLGWQLYPPGSFAEWDGLLHWYIRNAERMSGMLMNRAMRHWLRAAKLATADFGAQSSPT
jgi:hypothetical protein